MSQPAPEVQSIMPLRSSIDTKYGQAIIQTYSKLWAAASSSPTLAKGAQIVVKVGTMAKQRLPNSVEQSIDGAFATFHSLVGPDHINNTIGYIDQFLDDKFADTNRRLMGMVKNIKQIPGQVGQTWKWVMPTTTLELRNLLNPVALQHFVENTNVILILPNSGNNQIEISAKDVMHNGYLRTTQELEHFLEFATRAIDGTQKRYFDGVSSKVYNNMVELSQPISTFCFAQLDIFGAFLCPVLAPVVKHSSPLILWFTSTTCHMLGAKYDEEAIRHHPLIIKMQNYVDGKHDKSYPTRRWEVLPTKPDKAAGTAKEDMIDFATEQEQGHTRNGSKKRTKNGSTSKHTKNGPTSKRPGQSIKSGAPRNPGY
jgi:hypothetical protein